MAKRLGRGLAWHGMVGLALGTVSCEEYTCLDTASCSQPPIDAALEFGDGGLESSNDHAIDAASVLSAPSSTPATQSAESTVSDAPATAEALSSTASGSSPSLTHDAVSDASSPGTNETSLATASDGATSNAEIPVTSGPSPSSADGPSTSAPDVESELTSEVGQTSSSDRGDDTNDATSVAEDATSAPEPSGDPNPSGFPQPGAGGVARPDGAAGNLEVIPWAGFSGALSYTFDDAAGSQQGNKDAMLALGVKFTWYLTVGAGGSPLDAMYQDALERGHELGNHTVNHTATRADAEAMQEWLLTNYGVVGYTMAAPYGQTGEFLTLTNERFLVDRGVGSGSIGWTDNVAWTNLPSILPAQGAGEAVFKGYADTAATGKWQTVCIHGFTTGGQGSYQPVDFNGWKAGVEYAKTKNIWITSMVDVASYMIGGRAVSNATATAQGGGQKWTWTLKDTFPPDGYVRVTVDGGTLSQGGEALPWNEHGFYEVALDVGELTLTP